jgi:hypothetical protein
MDDAPLSGMWQAAKSVCMSRLASRGDVHRGIRLDIDQYRSSDLCEFLAETLEFAEIPYGVCPNAGDRATSANSGQSQREYFGSTPCVDRVWYSMP